MNQDPVLQILCEIRDKQDLTIEKQEQLEIRIDKIHDDCKKNAAFVGGMSGGLVSLGIALMKAKLGL